MLALLNSFFRLGIFLLLNRLTCKDHDMASAFLSSSILILRSLQGMNVEHLGLFSRSVKAQQPWYQIWDLGTKNKRAYSSSSSITASALKKIRPDRYYDFSLSLFFFFMMMLVTQYRIALCMCTLYYYYAMMAAASPSASRPLSLCPSG